MVRKSDVFYHPSLVHGASASVMCNTPVVLQNSLTRSAPIPSDAQGRSGARFHTSYNKKYVIKIITSEDVAEMHNILKKYHQVKGVSVALDTSRFSDALLLHLNVGFVYFLSIYPHFQKIYLPGCTIKGPCSVP